MKVLNYKDFRVTDEMLASKSKRFANYIIDNILFYLFFMVIAVVVILISSLLGSDAALIYIENLDSQPLLERLIAAVGFVIFYFILESTSQKTIGKLITQTKVVLENGEKPRPETIIIRSLCRLIPFEPFSFLGNVPKGWHDTMSKTYVVDTKIFEEHKKAHENYHLIGSESN